MDHSYTNNYNFICLNLLTPFTDLNKLIRLTTKFRNRYLFILSNTKKLT